MNGPEARTQPHRVPAVPCRQQRPVSSACTVRPAAIFESPSRNGEEEANSLTHTLTMSDIDYTQTAESLQTELEDEGVEVGVATLEDGIREGVETYSLDLSEAVRTVANKYTPDDSSSVSVPQLGGGNEQVAVEDIPDLHENAANESAWVDAEVEVLSTSESGIWCILLHS